MTITVSVKSTYGREVIYPECETGKLFAEIAGTKTLTRSAINAIKKLGYEVEVKPPTL